jgi:hypothetical protein
VKNHGATLLFTTVLTGAITFLPPIASQAQDPDPSFVEQFRVSGVTEVKFPHIAAADERVHLAANINQADAAYWQKTATADSFGTPENLGVAEDQPDYSTTSIAVGADGLLAYVWVNQPERTIYLRTKAPDESWASARTVARGQSFPVTPEVIIDAAGAITVAWRNPDQPISYRRTTDRGATWGAITRASTKVAINAPALAAGLTGELALTYTAGDGAFLQTFVGIWNGSRFVEERLSRQNSDYADPTITILPNGRLLAAWRGIAESGSLSGVFVGERQTDGSWQQRQLIGGTVTGKPSIIADADGVLHVVWTGLVGGTYRLWYAVRAVDGTWTDPVTAPSSGGQIFNAAAAVGDDADGARYLHAVSEDFQGDFIYLRAYRFDSGIRQQVAVAGRPIIAQDATRSAADTFDVTFTEVAGNPTEVRARWGTPPTDADAWQPYSTTLTVAAPVAHSTACETLTLFTQLRRGSTLQTSAASDTIVRDQAVQVSVSAAPEDGAAGYTNDAQAHWRIDDAGECSTPLTARTDVAGQAAQTITAFRPRSPTRYQAPRALIPARSRSPMISAIRQPLPRPSWWIAHRPC